MQKFTWFKSNDENNDGDEKKIEIGIARFSPIKYRINYQQDKFSRIKNTHDPQIPTQYAERVKKEWNKKRYKK